MTAIVLGFPGEVLQLAHLLAVRFLLPSLLGRLIITQVRFLYLFGWLRDVFWGTVEVLCFGSHLLLQTTSTGHHRSFLVRGFARKNSVYHIMNVTNYILHFSICLHVRCSYNPVVLYKPQCPRASQAWSICKVLPWLGLQESLRGLDFISHNPELQSCSSALLGLCVANNSMSFLCRGCRLCPESTSLGVWVYSWAPWGLIIQHFNNQYQKVPPLLCFSSSGAVGRWDG